MEAAALVGVAALLLIAATYLYAHKDNTSMDQVVASVNLMKAEMKNYAKAEELNGVRNIAADAMARSVQFPDACAKLVDERVKKLQEDIAILKSRADADRLQKAKQSKTVIHKHEYSKPVQVELYPEQVMKPKGKGRGALERSRQ